MIDTPNDKLNLKTILKAKCLDRKQFRHNFISTFAGEEELTGAFNAKQIYICNEYFKNWTKNI